MTEEKFMQKEKNYCDKCKKMTWHSYSPTTNKKDGYTECLECEHKRFFDNLKQRRPTREVSAYVWQ